MTDHRHFQLLIAATLDESISARDAAALAEHESTCPICREARAGMRADHQALAGLAPVLPAPWVRESILAAARERPARARWTLLLAAVLTLALAIGGGLIAGALLQQHRSLIRLDPIELTSKWTPVAIAVPETSSRLRTVTWSDGQFLAGGATADGATIWLSRDGLAWDEVTLPSGQGAEVTSLIAIGGRVMAGGSGPAGAVVWTREPAGAWVRSGLPGGNPGGGVNALLADGVAAVAVGWRADGGAREAAVWRTTEGGQWSAASVDPAPELSSVATLPNGGFVAASRARPSMFPLLSADGNEWSVGLLPNDNVVSVPGEAPVLALFGDRVYAIGTTVEGRFAVWRTTDGRDWLDVVPPAVAGFLVEGAKVIGERLLIVGSAGDRPISVAMERNEAFQVQSVDAWPGFDGIARFHDVTASNELLVAVGVRDPDGAVWALK